MTDLEKYAYIHCNQCRTDNRLRIDIQKTGHYQCGQCKSYLMFYGIEKQSKYKNWIWALIIAAPIAFIGYQNYPNENEWTKKKVQNFEKACESRSAQATTWSSGEIESYCQCVTEKLTHHKYSSVIKSTNYYWNISKKDCRSGFKIFGSN